MSPKSVARAGVALEITRGSWIPLIIDLLVVAIASAMISFETRLLEAIGEPGEGKAIIISSSYPSKSIEFVLVLSPIRSEVFLIGSLGETRDVFVAGFVTIVGVEMGSVIPSVRESTVLSLCAFSVVSPLDWILIFSLGIVSSFLMAPLKVTIEVVVATGVIG